MSDQAMVIVSDLDDSKHAEINIVQSVVKAERLVETLLEAGFDQARIRVFVGGEMGMHVRQRPIVSFIEDNGNSDPAPDEAAADSLTAASRAEDESRALNVEAEPYARNGVRFSAAFRPA